MMKNWKRISGCLLAAMLPGCAIAKNEVAGNGDRKKVEIFPEVQMHYNAGNNFRNYWHWNDHPLFLDRTVRHPETALHDRQRSSQGSAARNTLWIERSFSAGQFRHGRSA